MSSQFNEIFEQLESWYAGERGAYLLDQTRVTLQQHLDTAFGYHILQLGQLSGMSLIDGSPIRHHIRAGAWPTAGVDLLCDGDELPLESDSVDVVVAHHSLEFDPNPHQVLREIQRVLTPQGQLLLVGFNPYSLRGITTRCRGLWRHSPWRAYRPVSEHRLRDWLHLLGCEVQHSSFIYAVPPVGSGRLRRALQACDGWCVAHNLPVGGVYVVHAVKQVVAKNRPRPALRSRRRRLIGLATPSPAPRVPNRKRGELAARRGRAGDVAA